MPDCDRALMARGYCAAHYMRLRKYGDPTSGGPFRRETGKGVDRTKAAEDHFWSRVIKQDDGCWIWTGATEATGYGCFSSPSAGRVIRAHRYAYENQIGPIPAGLVIDHLCSVRNCVNPNHLEAVTDEENRRRGLRHGILNGRITHCPQGHEYTPENSARRANRKGIECRTCKRAQDTPTNHTDLSRFVP